jgi:DNA gyrase/topoisomerase IV subunit B
MMKKKENLIQNNEEIRVIDFPECVQMRTSLYLADAPMCLREIIDNSEDAITKTGVGDTVIVETNFNGFNFVADNSTGIPIMMSRDRPGQTQADVSISTLHSGSNFNDGGKTEISRGVFGVGSACVQAISEIYVLMSKVTAENYDKSLPMVKEYWEALGPRSKKEVFYYVVYEGGYKSYESVGRKGDIEKKLFGKGCRELPADMSTMVLFRIDPQYFEGKIKTSIPEDNIRNFLLIQEKFYKRKITFWTNGEKLDSSGFKPYKEEILRTITPADTSMNPYVCVYVTFEVDPGLNPKDVRGSVNGLDTTGVHLTYLEQCYEAALREEYKIKHKTIMPGLKMFVLVLATEPVYDSQTKTRLKSLAKVKPADFRPLVKDIIKVFRKDEEYWGNHVEKLNALADSVKSISAMEKAQRMIDEATGNNALRGKKDYVEGFCDATSKDRWKCSMYIVEGLSAGASLKSGRRTPEWEGILPIKGKIANVSKIDIDKALENKEIYTILKTVGLGIDQNNVTTGCTTREEAYEKIKKYSRYGKICLAADSDSDGQHIILLLLYLISKHARFLIDFGLVYISLGPLFKGTSRSTGEITYYYPNDEMDNSTMLPRDLNSSKTFSRYKGLGSLDKDEIYNAFFNPNKRRLIQVTSEGINRFMSLVEDIGVRKELLVSSGIISNPYGV